MEKSILITNYELTNFTGSELNSMAIAKRFKEIGYKVYMLAMFKGEPLCEKMKSCYDEIIDMENENYDFSNKEFDIVWAHHSFILSWLIFEKNIKAKKIIISSLSAKENFEVIPKYGNDLNLVLANSEETKLKLEQEGINNVYLLENCSFKRYFERDLKIKKLKNIAIISNHVPEELFKTKDLLEENGYNVVVYGFQGKRELITDKILENFDVIISIGKTVQYAMSLKIPIYIYDIHGGEGYLTLENLEKNRSRNFSGRGFEKKDAVTIYDEITQNFKQALLILEDLKQYALQNFCFEDNVDKIYKMVEEMQDINIEEIRKKYKNEIRSLMQANQMFINMKNKYKPVLQEIKDKEQEIINLNFRLEAQEKAKDNLILENKNLHRENEIINKEFESYRKKIESKISYKIYRKLKKLAGGKNE